MLEKENCGLVLVDVQGSLARMVHNSESMVTQTQKLLKCCQLLSIPIIWLEQYPKGLGATIPELSELMVGNTVNEKIHFNALYEGAIKDKIINSAKQQWLVVGIEAHICVYQTVLGLLNEGLEVEVVSDCISSRLQSNVDIALTKMRDNGASITSVEMCIYELMKNAKVDTFKDVLSIIK